MPKLGTSGSVRGARGNSRPYRDLSGYGADCAEPDIRPTAGSSRVRSKLSRRMKLLICNDGLTPVVTGIHDPDARKAVVFCVNEGM